ncbi:DUF6455 family protein [Nioella nitratireducens]|uniref:DUF6455 family protein n=1 Tax=Nioella nitratireducens TaxID=1287720 RepID=UPI0008FD7D66|nr:DUF6455 family protein [Nioella nitratireducens]
MPNRCLRPLGDPVRHFWLAQSMAKTAGVDLADAAHKGLISQQEWAGTVTRCRGCSWVEECERWLQGHDLSGAEAAPADCVNAGVFDRLRG